MDKLPPLPTDALQFDHPPPSTPTQLYTLANPTAINNMSSSSTITPPTAAAPSTDTDMTRSADSNNNDDSKATRHRTWTAAELSTLWNAVYAHKPFNAEYGKQGAAWQAVTNELAHYHSNVSWSARSVEAYTKKAVEAFKKNENDNRAASGERISYVLLHSQSHSQSEMKRRDEKKRKLREEQQRVIQNSVATLKDKQPLAKKQKKTTAPASLSPSSLSSSSPSSPTSLSSSCASRADLTRIAAEQVNVTRTLRDDAELHQRRMEALLERSVVAQEQSSQALKEFVRRAEQQ